MIRFVFLGHLLVLVPRSSAPFYVRWTNVVTVVEFLGTLAKTEIVYQKNVGALVAMNFT